MKRTRNELTEAQKVALEEAWRNGLRTTNKKRRTKSDTEILSKQTGLSPKQIDQWIGNRRAKDRRGMTAISQPRKKKRLQGPNGYALFIKSMKRGTKSKAEFLADVASKWRNLPEEDNNSFTRKAAEIRASPMLGMNREDAIHRHLGILNESCEFLATLGVYVGGFSLDPQAPDNPALFGGPRAVRVLTTRLAGIQQELLATSVQPLPQKPDKRKQLKQNVQAKFKTAWNEATKTTQRVPYKSIQEKEISVNCTGLPSGVSFGNPSKYPLEVLQAIVDGPDININITKQSIIDAAPSSYHIEDASDNDANNATAILDQLARGGQMLVEMVKEDEDNNGMEQRKHQRIHKEKKGGKTSPGSQTLVSPNSSLDDAPAENKDSTLYRVENIIRQKYNKSLVKWVGFETPTWELTKNIIEINY